MPVCSVRATRSIVEVGFLKFPAAVTRHGAGGEGEICGRGGNGANLFPAV
jgi:hypothetical protein